MGPMSRDVLHQNINVARESYEIERWWKYGQPAIDRISAVINVSNTGHLGAIVEGLSRLHGENLQLNIGILTHGVPVFDGARVEINIDQKVR